MRPIVITSVMAVIAAAPALPCTPGVPPTVTDLIVVGEDEVPTNVALVFVPFDVGAWQATVRVEGSTEPGDTFDFTGAVGPDGALDLEANTSYVVDVTAAGLPNRSVLFTTSAGPDETPPSPPFVEVRREHTGPQPRLDLGSECGGAAGLGGHWGGTSVNIDYGSDDDVVIGFHVVATDENGDVVFDSFRRAIDTDVSFFEYDPGVWSVAISAIDVAGNVGDATVVEADFGGCGGCASSSSLAPTAGVVLLLLSRRGRRR